MMANVHYNRTTTFQRREKINALWTSGLNEAQIAEEVGLSLNKFLQRGTYLPKKPGWKERTVSTPDVIEFVEYSKLTKPSSYTSEIRQALVGNGICAATNAPSRSTISDILSREERPKFQSQKNSLFALKSLSGSST